MSDLLAVHTLSTKPVDMRFFCDMVLASREELGEKQRFLTATHYKEKTGVGHEFLVLHIFNGSDTIFLRVERRPSLQSGEGSTPACPLTYDSISRVANLKLDDYRRDYWMLREASCAQAGPPITLWTVCDVMKEISVLGPNYRLLKQQCYWLCSMFIQLLKTRHVDLTVFKGKEDTRRGKAGLIRVMDTSRVDREIQRYLRQKRHDEEKAKRQMNDSVREGYRAAVKKQQRADAKATKQTRKLVSPLVGTRTGKTESDNRMVQMLLDRTREAEAERQRDTERQKKAKGFLEELAVRLAASSR